MTTNYEAIMDLWQNTRLPRPAIACKLGLTEGQVKHAIVHARRKSDERGFARGFGGRRLTSSGDAKEAPVRRPPHYEPYDDMRERRLHERTAAHASNELLAELTAHYGSPANCPSLRNVVR